MFRNVVDTELYTRFHLTSRVDFLLVKISFSEFFPKISILGFYDLHSDYPVLADVLISHLLWADDLVLLALTPKALQVNINILFDFCNSMGLEVNIKKTKIVIFSPPKRKQSYETFTLGGQPIQHTDKYCYLGIIFHRNGSFTAANTELRAKALRALYGLKGKIVKDALSHRALNILFDSLIKPILFYGCQVLCPH